MSSEKGSKEASTESSTASRGFRYHSRTLRSSDDNDDNDADDVLVNRKRPRADGDTKSTLTNESTDVPSSSLRSNTVVSNTANKLPDELKDVDFTVRIRWRKFNDINNNNKHDDDSSLSLTPVGTPPVFSDDSPALCFHMHKRCGQARANTVHLPHGPVPTPIFMPVGTKGTLKGVCLQDELLSDKALDCPIMLSNTYHLALQPTTPLLKQLGGLHQFMQWPRNILTDSGGFQMVSLLKLAKIQEEGVTFESPFEAGKMLLLRPEDSIGHQLEIGSDIMMALDDVVSSVTDNDARFLEATHRTLRWLDRCLDAHTNRKHQNLFAITQGGLDVSLGGMREQCLAGFRNRDAHIPGYAIGGVAGGESKDAFWRVVHQACQALPDDKPRYLMGVGYPLDLVVCVALGVDMFDCVYPTRTARFGVALIDGEHPGTLRLKLQAHLQDDRPIMKDCDCQACRNGISRKTLHEWLKTNNAVAAQLLTQHNIAYMMRLVRSMREAILEDRYGEYCRDFVRMQFRGKENGGTDVPGWVVDALQAAGIEL